MLIQNGRSLIVQKLYYSDIEKAQEILVKNKKTPYRLSKTIPVDIIYLTTLVDTDGTIMFYDDVYGYDKMQLTASKK